MEKDLLPRPRRTRHAAPMSARINPSWRTGDKVRWQHYSGIFLHDLGDGEHADIVIADRVHRIRTAELTHYHQRRL